MISQKGLITGAQLATAPNVVFVCIDILYG
jgi:hypothetical protein